MIIEKIRTDNPLLDEIIYNCKIMFNNCILKNEDEALKYETLESIKRADIYIAIIEGKITFDLLDYNREMLQALALPEYLILECLIDKNKIPLSLRPELVSIASTKYVEKYEELNSYYRMLNGIPDINDIGIKLNPSVLPDNILDVIDVNKYLHLMSDSEIELLTTHGIMSNIIKDNPAKKYLKYLGKNRISIYNARVASRFSLLHVDIPPSIEVYERFKTKLETNTLVILKTIYSQAYKLNSKYYDNFISIMILVQTMIDMIIELPEYIIRRDIFDLDTVKYIFESNGIDYFEEIPIQYQIAMIRNLNKLIKFKSTTVNIIDICKLFGFDNIDVFKYYILRDRKIDPITEKYLYLLKEVPDPTNPDQTITVEDNDANYELKFIKVPIDEMVDDYIKNPTNIIRYDDITLSYKYWDGDEPHEVVRSKILNKEFNYEQSGFISIDTLYYITELAFEIPYFFNMLFDTSVSKDQLKVSLPFINSAVEFNFVDVMIYLFALIYLYNGVEDSIMYSPSQVLQVKGFNFKANLSELSTYVKERGYTLEQLGVSDFQIPNNGILSYNQMMNIFIRNRKIYDHVVKQMELVDDLNLYNIYKKIYDALLLINLNMDYFKLGNGEIAENYTDFLEYKNSILYHSIVQVKSIEDLNVRNKELATIINNTVYSIQEYIDPEHYRYIFYNVPTISVDAIKNYIFKVINFFKSYKLELLNINTIYKLVDENKCKIMDNIIINTNFTKPTTYYQTDTLKYSTTMTVRDKISLIENVYIEPLY